MTDFNLKPKLNVIFSRNFDNHSSPHTIIFFPSYSLTCKLFFAVAHLSLMSGADPLLFNIPDHSAINNIAFHCSVERKVRGRTYRKPINEKKRVNDISSAPQALLSVLQL